jgi:hypothetical protein
MSREIPGPENCPTPEYHETHRYCPSCSWTEPQPPQWNDIDRAIVATYYTQDDWTQVLTAIEAHETLLTAIADAVRRRNNLPPYGPWPAPTPTPAL